MNNQPTGNDSQDAAGQPEVKRGWLLRILYHVYANYLGVTPPTPAQERVAAVALIGGVIVGLIAIVAVVCFLWRTMTQLGAGR